MSVYNAIHRFTPGPDGRCTGGWFNNASDWIDCRSRQRASILHDDPEAEFRQMHDHGGGDCMCFEDDPRGFYGAMRDFVRSRSSEIEPMEPMGGWEPRS